MGATSTGLPASASPVGQCSTNAASYLQSGELKLAIRAPSPTAVHSSPGAENVQMDRLDYERDSPRTCAPLLLPAAAAAITDLRACARGVRWSRCCRRAAR